MKIFNSFFKHNKILLVILSLFVIMRIPSLIEPYWYGDEGVYQVLGKAINNGKVLYRDIWDNKPPLLYLIYSAANSDQFNIRLISALVSFVSVICFYLLSKYLLKEKLPSVISTASFAYLLAIPSLEGNIANAENFLLLPIIAAFLILYKKINTIEEKSARPFINIFVIGFLLGVAFLFKIVAIFDLASVLFIYFIFKFKSLNSYILLIKDISGILLGFISPIFITIIYFYLNNSLIQFIEAVFMQNISYVGYGNRFFIPQGLLILKIMILSLALFTIFAIRKKISKEIIFILIWTSFSIFNLFFSQRPYTHYLLVITPSFSLLFGSMFSRQIPKKVIFSIAVFLFISIIIIGFAFKKNSLIKMLILKPYSYYENFYMFISGNKNLKDYYNYFDSNVYDDYQISNYIKVINKTKTILFWGNTPQLYTLTNTLPPGRFTVAYHINSAERIAETETAIMEEAPHLIVILNETKNTPLFLKNYTYKATINNAVIYERTFF